MQPANRAHIYRIQLTFHRGNHLLARPGLPPDRCACAYAYLYVFTYGTYIWHSTFQELGRKEGRLHYTTRTLINDDDDDQSPITNHQQSNHESNQIDLLRAGAEVPTRFALLRVITAG